MQKLRREPQVIYSETKIESSEKEEWKEKKKEYIRKNCFLELCKFVQVEKETKFNLEVKELEIPFKDLIYSGITYRYQLFLIFSEN